MMSKWIKPHSSLQSDAPGAWDRHLLTVHSGPAARSVPLCEKSLRGSGLVAGDWEPRCWCREVLMGWAPRFRGGCWRVIVRLLARPGALGGPQG